MKILTTPFLICIITLTHLIETKQVQQEYDDPRSISYLKLRREYKELLNQRYLANGRGGYQNFYLRPFEKSCKNRCREVRNNTYFCHCDRLCALYKDCCIDYWTSCKVRTKPFNRSTQALWQCVDAKYKKPENESRVLPQVAYMMITRCPPKNKTTNHSSLECLRQGFDRNNLSEVIPVMGEDGRSYANRYCAKCHGIHDDKYLTFWGLKVLCVGTISRRNFTYKSDYLHKNCTWYYAPPNTTHFSPSPCTYTTLCERMIESPESKNYKDLIEKCQAYMQVVYSGTQGYKNFHCIVCNGINISEIERPPPMSNTLPSLAMFFDYDSLVDDQDADSNIPDSDRNCSLQSDRNCSINSNRNCSLNCNTAVSKVTSPHDVIGSYVTIVGLSLSIVCLSMVVITYVWFPKLRTVPGLILLGLSQSLISYQVFLLVSPLATSQLKICKGVAVLLHFMILSAFSWMTIMSYDVARTFTMKGKSSGRSNSSSAFRRYLIVAVSIPAVIVGLSLTLDETNTVDVGYGESNNGSCWIGKPLALILFFYIPVGILLLFNAIALILTILSIRKVSKLTEKVQKSVKSDSRGQNAKIYSKLSTVMGITWFLGFGLKYSPVIVYLYIILNSLQGVFIFVTFVLNKRTINLWRYERSTRGKTSSSKRLTKQSHMGKSHTASAPTNRLRTTNEDKSGVTLSLSNLQQ